MSSKNKPKIKACLGGFICTSPPPYDCTSVLFKGNSPAEAYKGWKAMHDNAMNSLWRETVKRNGSPVTPENSWMVDVRIDGMWW
ncbi:hypothetical protein ERD95_06125 [Enterobacteriaceae bacterium ML5]|nr:hypothetical protein ERD95_06125 [Enterobacteriaceae bacterium ML5]